ncbi:tetratricopeptide repeat protein [Bradyrhizobium sp.]|uniref:tetratricopeptide repeat protein n=1 Tax=Bradyrhizobium sp. TaxID=376 RepID=UPI003C3DF94A
MKIRLTTVTWGRDFVDLFLRLTIPSLLAEGNIPAIADAHQVGYTIYTTADDAQILERHRVFQNLRRQIDVTVSVFSPSEIDPHNHGSHGILWRRAIELARRNEEVLFFIIPDLLYGQGSLMNWATRMRDGAKAVFTLGPQVVLETILPEIERRFGSEIISIGRQELLDLLYRHFHPLHAAMRRDSPRRPPHPEYDLRIVPGQGAIVRDIVSNPFCLDPSHFSELRHYSPQHRLDRIVLEPCSTLSVEPLLKRLDGYFRAWPLDGIRLSNLAGWWHAFATESCVYESQFPVELYDRSIPGAEAERRRCIAGGRFYRSQLIIAGRLFRLFDTLRGRGYAKAAMLLAVAIYAGRLRRRIVSRENPIILVPTDAAIERDWERIRELLVPGREREFVDLIRDHVLISGSRAPLLTARGLPAEPLLGALPAQQPFNVEAFTIYSIHRVLWREAEIVHSAQPATAAGTAPPPTGVFAMTTWAQQSRTHRLIYHAVQIPFIEPLVAPVFLTYDNLNRKGALKLRLRAWVEILYFVVATLRHPSNWRSNALRVMTALSQSLGAIPIVRRFARLPGLFVISLVTDGPRMTWKRSRTKIARWYSRVAPGFPLPSLAAKILYSKIPEERSSLYIGAEDAAVLAEVRSVRALQAVGQVLGEFQAVVATSRSVPLAMVDRRLGDLEKSIGRPVAEALEAELVGLTKKYPRWAEAWLDLAFLYQDTDRNDLALDCFARAMHGDRCTDFSDRCISPQAIAAANHGRALSNQGLLRDACDSFSLCLKLDPAQKAVAVEYADALRGSGELEFATHYYLEGMYYQETRWNLPAFPRDVSLLSFAHIAGPKRAGALSHPRSVGRSTSALQTAGR